MALEFVYILYFISSIFTILVVYISGRGGSDVVAVPADKVAWRVVVGDDDDLVGLGLGLSDAHFLAALPHHLRVN